MKLLQFWCEWQEKIGCAGWTREKFPNIVNWGKIMNNKLSKDFLIFKTNYAKVKYSTKYVHPKFKLSRQTIDLANFNSFERATVSFLYLTSIFIFDS
jgi:hypothetical protein